MARSAPASVRGAPPCTYSQRVKVTMLLCDAAQEVGGKLYILGGGWSVKGPEPMPMGLAIKIDVPWTEANERHQFVLTLESGDGGVIELPGPDGPQEVRIDGGFEVGRPAGTPAGSDIDAALAVNIGPLPLPPGLYSWQLAIDNQAPPDWRRTFAVQPT